MTQVLVVEDDAWQAEHMTRQLSQAGFSTTVAAHALEAIDHIDATPPEIIVLDMFLPGANGMTLLHELHSHADLAKIPIIVCSTESFELRDLRPYGVVAVLDKTTMKNDEIARTVRRVLG